MTDDESINELAEVKREEAFLAPAFEWKGVKLHPLAIGRESAWLLHCRRVGLPPLHEVMSEGETFLAHAIRLIWFCAHESDDWLAAWMLSRAHNAEALSAALLDNKISKWADEHIACGDEAAQAIDLAKKIHDRSRASRAIAVDEAEGDELGNAHGPSTSRNTARSLRGPAPASSRKTKSSTISRKSGGGLTSTAKARVMELPTNGPKPSRRKKGR